MTPEHRLAILIMCECGMTEQAIAKDPGWRKVARPRLCEIVQVVNEGKRPPMAVVDGKSQRILTYCGETKTLGEWEKKTGIDRKCISARLLRDWPVERALTEKPHHRRQR